MYKNGEVIGYNQKIYLSICKKQIFNWVTVETTDSRNYKKNSVVTGKKYLK